MAYAKCVPHAEGQENGQPLAHARMFRGRGLLPKIPIRWKKANAQRDRVLFEIEGSDGPPVAEFLHWNSNIGTVFDVNPGAKECLDQVDDGDQRGIGSCRNRTAVDETARHLSRRHQNGRHLKRERCQQGEGQHEVDEEQDFPERIFPYYAEYYVHGVSPASYRSDGDTRLINNYRMT